MSHVPRNSSKLQGLWLVGLPSIQAAVPYSKTQRTKKTNLDRSHISWVSLIASEVRPHNSTSQPFTLRLQCQGNNAHNNCNNFPHRTPKIHHKSRGPPAVLGTQCTWILARPIGGIKTSPSWPTNGYERFCHRSRALPLPILVKVTDRSADAPAGTCDHSTELCSCSLGCPWIV